METAFSYELARRLAPDPYTRDTLPTWERITFLHTQMVEKLLAHLSESIDLAEVYFSRLRIQTITGKTTRESLVKSFPRESRCSDLGLIRARLSATDAELIASFMGWISAQRKKHRVSKSPKNKGKRSRKAKWTYLESLDLESLAGNTSLSSSRSKCKKIAEAIFPLLESLVRDVFAPCEREVRSKGTYQGLPLFLTSGAARGSEETARATARENSDAALLDKWAQASAGCQKTRVSSRKLAGHAEPGDESFWRGSK